jgi:hypothetical protein
MRTRLPREWARGQAAALDTSDFGRAVGVVELRLLVRRLAQPDFDDAWALAARGEFAVR